MNNFPSCCYCQRIFYAIISLILLISSSFAYAFSEKPPGYAVASAHPLATAAGLKILSEGGNAFDAAVAVSAVLAVVEPYHSGLGGGGFWLLHEAKSKKNVLIDGREVAPRAAHNAMFLNAKGQSIRDLSLKGGLSAAIPGEPAALVYLAKYYGRLPLRKSLAPAIELAVKGFPADSQFIFFSSNQNYLPLLQHFSATAGIFLNKGNPFRLGERLQQRDLAKTFRILAAKGHAGFYKGEVAMALVKAVHASGGIWTLDDLARYRIIPREPLQGIYHTMRIITVPPPSSGGVILLTALNILEEVALSSFSEEKWVHYLIEAMRLAYWQANENLADPEFISINLEKFLSRHNAKRLRTLIFPDKSTPSQQLATKESIALANHENTTHVAIIDEEGNRVSATMTINYIFGSGIVAAGTGVLLNDEMDDFSSKVGAANVFGIVGSEANKIEPGKRPLSSMTPTFLEMPGRVAILGTPGGSRIPSMLLLAALRFYHYTGAISMVSAMRFHHQYLPDVLEFEPETFSPILQENLEKMGYALKPLKQYYGDMQAISWDKSLNLLTAASDPRHIGLAVVVTRENSTKY